MTAANMELKLDVEEFDVLQRAFITEVTKSILVKLAESGMEGQALERLTADIAMSVASVIDDTTGIESNGKPVKPYLAFWDGEQTITHAGENAYTYEFMMPVLKDIFDV